FWLVCTVWPSRDREDVGVEPDGHTRAVDGQRWPCARAGVEAGRRALGVISKRVEGPAVGVDEHIAEVRVTRLHRNDGLDRRSRFRGPRGCRIRRRRVSAATSTSGEDGGAQRGGGNQVKRAL